MAQRKPGGTIMTDQINRKDMDNVTGGAAEAVREITDENALNNALKELNVPLNDANLSKPPLNSAMTKSGSCSACHSKKRKVSVLQ
jgi:hypothetical protein